MPCRDQHEILYSFIRSLSGNLQVQNSEVFFFHRAVKWHTELVFDRKETNITRPKSLFHKKFSKVQEGPSADSFWSNIQCLSHNKPSLMFEIKDISWCWLQDIWSELDVSAWFHVEPFTHMIIWVTGWDWGVGFLRETHLAHELLKIQVPFLPNAVLWRKALAAHAVGVNDYTNMAMKEFVQLTLGHFPHPCLGYMAQIWGDLLPFVSFN